MKGFVEKGGEGKVAAFPVLFIFNNNNNITCCIETEYLIISYLICNLKIEKDLYFPLPNTMTYVS